MEEDTQSDFIQVSVRGWPDKSHERDIRIIFHAHEHKDASQVMQSLGGLFRCESKRIKADERPQRSEAEIWDALTIIHYVTSSSQSSH